MLGLLIFVISIVVWVIICKKFYDIACDKGHNSIEYFMLPFFLGIIGFLIVAALPDRGDCRIDQLKKEVHELKLQLANYQSKSEPKPAILQKPSEETPIDDSVWLCGKCGKRNMNSNTKCWSCNTNR